MNKTIRISHLSGIVLLSVLFNILNLSAQDERSQIPPLLQRSYFEVNLGYINYPFGAAQMEPGYTLESVNILNMAVRLVLWG